MIGMVGFGVAAVVAVSAAVVFFVRRWRSQPFFRIATFTTGEEGLR